MFGVALHDSGLARHAAGSSYQTEVLGWIDKLGYRDEIRKPFVRVDYRQAGQPHYSFGFLVRERSDSFDVLLPNLSTRTYYKQEDQDANIYSSKSNLSKFKPASLETFVHKLTSSPNEPVPDYAFITDFNLWGSLGLDVTLAWICQQKGMDHDVEELLAIDKSSKKIPDETSKGLATEEMEEFVADAVFKDLTRRFEEPQISRAELASMFGSFSTRFQGTRASKVSESIGVELQAMVKEDAAHQSKSSAKSGNKSKDEEVSELVWNLRDSTEHSTFETGPATKLTEVGLPAVPRLLDALHDTRFTRAIPFVENKIPSPPPLPDKNVIRVQDLAGEALGEIAHRSFDPENKDDFTRIEASARNWWASIGANGEESTLIAGVRRADDSSYQQAEDLIRKFPKTAFKVIRSSVENTRDPGARSDLIRALENLNSPEVAPFVRRIATDDREKDFRPRMEAADVLARSDAEAAILVVEKELVKQEGLGEDSFIEVAIPTLIGSQRISALRWLQHHFPHEDGFERAQVVAEFFQGIDSRYASLFHLEEEKPLAKTPENRAALAHAVEDLLATELEDHHVYHRQIDNDGSRIEFDELNEMAQYALAKCFPKKYTFANPQSRAARNKLRIRNLNIYRESRGLAPIAARAVRNET